MSKTKKVVAPPAIDNLIGNTPKKMSVERYRELVAGYFSIQTQIQTYPSLLAKSGVIGKELSKLLITIEHIIGENKMI